MQAVGKETTTVVTTCIDIVNEIPEDTCKDIIANEPSERRRSDGEAAAE